MEFRITPCLNCGTLNKIPLAKLTNSPKCGNCKQFLAPAKLVYDVTFAVMDKIIANSPIPVLVDFWAPWCGPCQGFAPVYQQAAESHPQSAIYLKFNSDHEAQLIQKFNIRGIPTLILFTEGHEKTRQSGAMPFPAFEAWLKQNSVI